MALKQAFYLLFVIASAASQTYRVCVPSSSPTSLCQSLSKDDSRVTCNLVESRVDCALRLSRGEADIGYFSEEEIMLLAQQLPNDNRVIASVRDATKMDLYAFESVAVVPSNHTGGLEGLRGGVYCHPGLDETDLRWSPRVLKTLEELVARTDRCPEADTRDKTAEELEVHTLSQFFSQACRPGAWSANATVDADLKSRYPSLCDRCGANSGCTQYTIEMGVSIAGVRNENRHIQALECLRTNVNASAAVAYIAWQHVKEYFTLRNPSDAASFSVLCPNGSLVALSSDVLGGSTSPCAFVRQPWGAIVASTATATELLTSLQTWWPSGVNPGGNTWQSVMFTTVAGGTNARVVFETAPVSALNYTAPVRSISSIDSTSSCLPARRWCTTSTPEQTKCNWVRASAYVLGLEPRLDCQQRTSVFDCLKEIKENRADFISAPSNYGYLARQHFQLTPVKLVQNMQASTARVAAFIKDSAATSGNITRFENLRDKKACFPEFGGLAYVTFVRAGQERAVLSAAQCDYARALGEYFAGACAPGALDASHALSDQSSFDSSTLCSVCKPAIDVTGNFSNAICSFDYTNLYFGNNGSLACLADPDTDVAVLNTQNITGHLQRLGLQATQFRALCRNNSLAATAGVAIDDNCLLAHVVDAEVVTRRSDPLYNALNALFDVLDYYFGYNAATGSQLINLEVYSPFDGNSDLLFKDSTIGLTEPSLASTHAPAKNYIELFTHLQACTSTAAPPAVAQASRSFYAIIALVIMSIMTQIVIY